MDVFFYGYNVIIIDVFDVVVNWFFKDDVIFVVFIIVFYEGELFDNVIDFVIWIKDLFGIFFFKGIFYVVFGCGYCDWVNIFYKVFCLVYNIFE